MVVVVVQSCEYSKNHWTVHSKWVNYVVCENGISIKLFKERKMLTNSKMLRQILKKDRW